MIRDSRQPDHFHGLCFRLSGDALDVVFAKGFASPTALMKAARVHSRQGRAGIPALRDALAEWIVDGKPADSKLEPKMRSLLSDFGLPPAQFHAWIAGHEVDFWIVDTRVVLECDGWDAHGKTRRQFERTNDRNSDLIARGYLPIPFTWHQLTKRRALIAQRIRDGLEHFG
jgi:very-short-patch-repair endonuclease